MVLFADWFRCKRQQVFAGDIYISGMPLETLICEQIPCSFDGLLTSAIFSYHLQFKQEMVDTLYNYAKFQYECGNYSGTAEYLYFVRVLVSYLVHIVTQNTFATLYLLPYFFSFCFKITIITGFVTSICGCRGEHKT